MFEAILVVFNVCIIAAVIIEALMMTCPLECLIGRRSGDDFDQRDGSRGGQFQQGKDCSNLRLI